MHPQLDEYQAGFRALKDEATTLVADVDADMLRRPPDTEAWSVAQIFDHVNTAGWLLLSSLETAIETAQADGPYGEPPFRYGFVSRWFVRSMQPSSGWTFRAPSVFEPDTADTLYPDEAVEEFLALQGQFADCVDASDGLDLRSIRVASPAVPLLRISLGAWFEATLAHERRHLDQAREVLQALEAA